MSEKKNGVVETPPAGFPAAKSPAEVLRSIDWEAFKRDITERIDAMAVFCRRGMDHRAAELNDQIVTDLMWPNFMLLFRFYESFEIEEEAFRGGIKHGVAQNE